MGPFHRVVRAVQVDQAYAHEDCVSCNCCPPMKLRDCNFWSCVCNYHPQLRKGYVFTPVCQSFCSQGMSGQTPLPGRTPPPRDGHSSGQYAFYWNAFLFSLSTGVNPCDHWTSPYRDPLGPPPVHGLPTLWTYSNLLNFEPHYTVPLSKYVRSCSLWSMYGW